MSEQAIEREIQSKGLNAPRLTPEHIDSVIVGTRFHVFGGSLVTICCMKLKNGFSVIGESHCVSPDNFNEEIGEKIAAENAREKVWELEGYLLKQRLHDDSLKERS